MRVPWRFIHLSAKRPGPVGLVYRDIVGVAHPVTNLEQMELRFAPNSTVLLIDRIDVQESGVS